MLIQHLLCRYHARPVVMINKDACSVINWFILYNVILTLGEMPVPTLKRVNTVGVRYITGEIKAEHFEIIIEQLLHIPEDEVIGIDERYKKFLLKVDNEARYLNICENYTEMQMNVEPGVVIEVSDISSYRSRVVVRDVPFEVGNEKLKLLLSQYGHVEKIYNQNNYKLKNSKYEKVKTGKKIVWMDIEEPIPSSILIKQTGTHISFTYENQYRTCYNCGLADHERKDCQTEEEDRVNVIDLEDLYPDSDDENEEEDENGKENNSESDTHSKNGSNSGTIPADNNISAEIYLNPTQEVKQYACSKCDYKCTYENILADHMETHTEENPFSCNECENKYKSQEELANHLRIHKTNGKQFKCTKCEIGFTDEKLLETHMLSHTVEKPFQCNKCDESFMVEGELKMHMQNHTEENVTDATANEWVG